MDFLLYLYCLLFGIILVAPFLVFYYRFRLDESPFGKDEGAYLKPFTERKNNLLDSLKDIRSDFDSGKLTEEEFQTQSLPYIEALDSLEVELKEKKANVAILPTPKINENWTCASCGSFVAIPNAKFCPNCGVGRLA
ncbi:zinc ribbon domain-containing protein [Leptospira sp. 2 VSF19]|uniref:Zinc ribbon domain-containing protein n=1 Tax=Leptospira soteropolitanensis TaxID=2950025 RepID=A0AAW5VP76_9LEPT|nr:zinc ribbon domain-containing protein [Leptospira soteropolitanensis]MCW7494178.1 zinc ribbon domain-containing protein [Leptospira soteropolitanensis]MCW7501847.1 zinc ribbon domain-containing protein [Leptospira soteropolitanensis]MCW7524024.1 zinc ribbon domain-containing protein [Leptospira soteropolitanensis]MCW7527889.1 zinc ribbon domain-containing protein [Leptospira soteropolitanensis]MCW7531817.1 zinc ribbon domain-containing protein [Leptospira soteropolitanensis]